MLERLRLILIGSDNKMSNTFVLNAISSCFIAIQSVVILMFLTRFMGVEEAGVYSMAQANAGLLLYIGFFGIRRYQASDLNEEFSFGDYIGFRLLTCAAMVFACLIYCLYANRFSGHSFTKSLVVFFVCMTAAVQAYSDVFEGNLQQKGRLDIAAKCVIVRNIVIILTYIIVTVFTHNLLLASVAGFAFALISFYLTSYNVSLGFGERKVRLKKPLLKKLLITGYPLFLAMFLHSYIGNAPKYAIDTNLNDSMQAVYGFVFMPTFAIGIVCNFIFNPLITKYTLVWNEGRIALFKKLVRRQLFIITFITGLALIVAATIGIPVLSIMFGVDLSDYRRELIITILGGGGQASVSFFTAAITILRKQKSLMYGYFFTTVASIAFAGYIVVRFELIGAAWMYTSMMLFLTALFGVFIWRFIGEEEVRLDECSSN